MKHVNITHKVRRLMQSAFANTIPSAKGMQMICEETVLTVNGEIIAIYKKVTYDLTAITNACLYLKFPSYERTNGLVTETININASPRNARRTNMCRPTKFRSAIPDTHGVFLEYALRMAKDYRRYFLKQYAGQVKQMYSRGRIHSAYRIKGTPFTSGVINKNSALGYHRDMANTIDGISCMLCLKQGVAGGQLILPELRIGFECQDGYVLLFDGQKYLHGVTPIIQPLNGKGYRYTIVYYNNKGMVLCLPPDQEIEFYRHYIDQQTEIKYQKQFLDER